MTVAGGAVLAEAIATDRLRDISEAGSGRYRKVCMGHAGQHVTYNNLHGHSCGTLPDHHLRVAGPSHWPATQSPDHQCRLFQNVCLRRICLLDGSALSALEVL